MELRDRIKILLEDNDTQSTITLNKHYEGQYPEDNEIIWNYVSRIDFDEELNIIYIDVQDIFNNWLFGDVTIKEAMQYADTEQIGTINYYKNNISEAKRKPIIVDFIDKIVVDGYHRIAGMALAKENFIKAIDVTS